MMKIEEIMETGALKLGLKTTTENEFDPQPGSVMWLLGNLKTHLRNWKVRGTGKAYRVLTKAMRYDPDYAHSWQCNIAMPIFDGAKGKLTHAEANAIADDLMSHLFDVKKANRK